LKNTEDSMQHSETYRSNTPAARWANTEALLADYPDIPAGDIDDVVNWFDREASAYDVAMMASNNAIQAGYRKFRSDHVDPFGTRDFIRAGLFLTAVAACVLAIIWLTP